MDVEHPRTPSSENTGVRVRYSGHFQSLLAPNRELVLGYLSLQDRPLLTFQAVSSEDSMLDGNENPDDAVRSDAHEEFLELCAVATSGSLSEEERKRLAEHVAVCPECRKAMKEFEAAVACGVPALASELAPELTGETPQDSSSFSEEAAEASYGAAQPELPPEL